MAMETLQQPVNYEAHAEQIDAKALEIAGNIHAKITKVSELHTTLIEALLSTGEIQDSDVSKIRAQVDKKQSQRMSQVEGNGSVLLGHSKEALGWYDGKNIHLNVHGGIEHGIYRHERRHQKTLGGNMPQDLDGKIAPKTGSGIVDSYFEQEEQTSFRDHVEEDVENDGAADNGPYDELRDRVHSLEQRAEAVGVAGMKDAAAELLRGNRVAYEQKLTELAVAETIDKGNEQDMEELAKDMREKDIEVSPAIENHLIETRKELWGKRAQGMQIVLAA